MKKTLKLISIAILSGTILAVSACSTTTSGSSISSNWYKNTSISKNILGTQETVTYDVTFEKGTDTFYNYTYETGSYSMKLVNTTYGEKQESVYKLTTEFLINGSVNGSAFQDSLSSVCYFRPTLKNLQPLESEKNVKATSPSPKDSNRFISYDFSYKTIYNDTATNATVSFTNHKNEEENYSAEYSLSNHSTVWDNEQLLFSVRGLDLSSSSYFTILNTSEKEAQKIAVKGSTASKDKFTFDMGAGEKEYELNYNAVTLSIDKNISSGAPIYCKYASLTSATNNIYRNVMLKMSRSLSYNIGTLNYTLKTASFAKD